MNNLQFNNPKKNPPPFSSLRSYEQWKKEIKAWTSLTAEPEVHWANIVALGCLSESDPSGIREKVFALNLYHDPAIPEVPAAAGQPLVPAVPQNDLAGWDRLMEFMDSEFAKDSLADMCEHIRNFMTLKKSKDVSMKAYISDFEATYKKARIKGLPEMPHKFMMWFLLESVDITDQEYMLAISGVPTDSADMYGAVKASMLKLFNTHRHVGSQRSEAVVSFDPTLDTHWGHNGGQRGNRGGSFRGGRGGARGRGSTWHNPNTKQGVKAEQANKPMNPLDADGNPYTCNSCGSYRHFTRDCQHAAERKISQYYGESGDPIPPDDEGTQVYSLENDEVIKDDQVDGATALTTHFGTVKLYDVLWTSNQIKESYFSKSFISSVTLDSGCLRNVAGKTWLKGYLKTLPPDTIAQVKKYPSSAKFRFGGDDIRDSLGLYHIPCNVAGKDIILQVDIITSEIPCLISKATMKRAGGVMNFRDDTIDLFGETVKLEESTSGHYTLPISDIKDKANITTEVFMANTTESPAIQEAQVKKVHHVLGHPSRQAFTNHLKATNMNIPNLDTILNKLYKSCSTCLQFHKAHVKPKVSLPLANDFNETITLDLKIWPKYGKVVFYIIDAFTRFCQSHPIPDKTPETIIEKLLDNWILNLYGAPKNILTDCGGEFYNGKFKDMAQNLNIKLYTTAAESPFQNGICERNHALTDRIVEKMLTDDPNLDFDKALSAATFAKNSLINVNGFSPIQLVTGKSPRLPSVMDNCLPAQESVSSVKIYSDRANAIFSARKVFMEAENAKRLNQALKVKVSSPTVIYKPGDKVNYRKQGKDTPWQGPAEVIGTKNHGKTIFISHGRFVYSTSQPRLIKIPDDNDVANEVSTQQVASTQSPTLPTQPTFSLSQQNLESDSDDDDNVPPVNNPVPDNNRPPPALQPTPPPPPPPPMPPIPNQIRPILHNNPIPTPPPASDDINLDIDTVDHSPQSTDRGISPQTDSAMATRGKAIKKKGKKPYPKKGETIFFRIKNGTKYGQIHPALVQKYGQEWVKAKVLRKVYDNSQKCGPYFNIEVIRDGIQDGVHLDQTEWSFCTDRPMPKTLSDSIHNYLVEEDPDDVYVVHIDRKHWHKPEVQEAMKKELSNFSNFDVYDLVEDKGQHFITSGWVIVEKEKEGSRIIKARCVIHGNQELLPVRSDSPTVKKSNLRIQLTLAIQNDWVMCSADVTAAFLQAINLDREVHVKPVPEAGHQGLLWRLKKPMYGLGDSGRLWYLTIVSFLEERGCSKLITDLAFLYYHKEGILHGIITIHVDDLQYCGSNDFESEVIQPMFTKFQFGMMQSRNFKCLGWELNQHDDHLTVDQLAYVEEKVKLPNIDIAGRDNDDPLTAEEISLMRATIGQMRWVVDQTRPDVAFEELELAMSVTKATVKDVKTAIKMINHVKNHPIKIRYNKLPGDEWYLSVYTDAAKNLLPDGASSAQGFIVFLTNGHRTNELAPACPLYWKSGKSPRIVGSTMEGEAMAMEEGLNVAYTLKKEICAITNIPDELIKIEALCDCDDAVKAVNSDKQNKKKDRVSWDIARIRQMKDNGEIHRIKWHEGTGNVADVFTKKSAPKHLMLRTLEHGIV